MFKKIRDVQNKTLMRWILVGCVVLMIPLISAVINFFVNKNLIEKKIEQVNEFMLKNIQYNIDIKLEDMKSVARQYQLNKEFSSYALNGKSDEEFLKRVRNCYQELSLSRKANPAIEVMIYIPERGYILGSKTANTVKNVYDSLLAQGKMELSLDEWKQEMIREDGNEIVISRYMSYINYGEECLVYVAPILYSDSQNAGWIFISTPTEFIEKLMDSEVNRENTILILDGDQNVVAQYGMKRNMGRKLEWTGDQNHFETEIDGEYYVGACLKSNLADWSYVVCTPEATYMEEMVRNRNWNFMIVFLGAVIGVIAVVLMERRNYRPVRALMDILPEREEMDTDEFAALEKNLKKLFSENQFMQETMEARREYDRELGLLSVIKGRTGFFRKLTDEELLGKDREGGYFSFATIKLAVEEKENEALPIDYDMLVFLVQNVITDTFGEEYSYIKTIDDKILVYLFLLPPDQDEAEWKKECREKMVWINEFFQSRLELDLPITIGDCFSSFSEVETVYANLQEVNEQRYYTCPEGVMEAEQINKIDVASLDRLNFYSKRLEAAAAEADFGAGKAVSEQLFEELETSGNSFLAMLFYVLSIVNNLLMMSRNMVQDEAIRRQEVEDVLVKIRRAESMSTLKDSFYHFLRLICRAVDQDSQDSVMLSERIKKYVREHYNDYNVNISSIADEMGITLRYMSKIFRDQTGVGLLQYINDLRIEQAKRLLKTTGKTVDEIAEETGFANTRTFRRNFQKATGVTAKEYKNR